MAISKFHIADGDQFLVVDFVGPATDPVPSGAQTIQAYYIGDWGGSSGSSGTNWGDIGGSLALQTDLSYALAAKEPALSPGTSAQYYRGDKTWQNLPSPDMSGYEPLVSAGTSAQYYRGDKTWQTLPTFSGLTSVGATAPVSSTGGTTPTISISQASTNTDGYLSSGDWNTFNSKQPSGAYLTSASLSGYVPYTGNTSGVSLSAPTSATIPLSVSAEVRGTGGANLQEWYVGTNKVAYIAPIASAYAWIYSSGVRSTGTDPSWTLDGSYGLRFRGDINMPIIWSNSSSCVGGSVVTTISNIAGSGGYLQIGTSGANSSGSLLLANISASGKISTQDNTIDSTIVAGTFEIQSYAVNNGWLSDNAYYGSSGWTRRRTGRGWVNYFYGNTFSINSIPSGAAGGAGLSLAKHLVMDDVGNVGLGGTIVAGDWTDASVVIAPSGVVTVYGRSTTSVPLTINAAAGQVGNLQEWKNSTGAVMARIANNGGLLVSNANGSITLDDYGVSGYNKIGGSGHLVFSNAETSGRSYYFQGGTVDMASTSYQYMSTQVWNAAATLSKSGNFIQLGLAASGIGFSVKAAAGQSANLQEWQNSTGGVMAYMDKVGYATSQEWNVSGGIANLTTRYGNGGLFINGQYGTGVFFSSGAASIGTPDVSITRASSGVLRIGTGGASADGSLKAASGLFSNVSSASMGGLLTIQGDSSYPTLMRFYNASGGNLMYNRWDGGNFHHYYNVPVFINLNGNSLYYSGNNTACYVALTGKAQFAIDPAIDGTSTGVAFGNWAYATSGTTKTYSLAAQISTWAWDGSYGYNIQSRTQLWQSQSSSAAGDAKLSLRNHSNQDVFAIGMLGGATSANAANATSVPFTVVGYTAQSANLQEWKNSTGSVLASINNSGTLSSPVVILTGTTYRNLSSTMPAVSAGDGLGLVHEYAKTNTSGQTNIVAIYSTYNQASGSSSSNTDFLINRTQTAIGSGAQLLIDARSDGVSKFSVGSGGMITGAALTAPSLYSGGSLVLYPYGGAYYGVQVLPQTAITAASAVTMYIAPTYNQPATSSNSATDLLIARTETSVGSGAQYLIEGQVGGARRFGIDNAGNIRTSASLGPELAPTLVSGAWTCGAGWYVSGGKLICSGNAGGTTAVPTGSSPIVAGTTYQVTMTIDSVTNSYLSYSIGGKAGLALSPARTFTDYITAFTTTALTFTQAVTADNIAISAISVKAIASSASNLVVDGSAIIRSQTQFTNPVQINTMPTWTPLAPLEVMDTVGGESIRVYRNNNQGQYLAINEAGGGGHIIKGYGQKIFGFYNTITVDNAANPVFSFYNYNSTALMGLSLSGAMGLGVYPPQAKLHIVGNSTTSAGLIVDTPAGQASDLQQWKVNSSSAAYMDASGCLHVGWGGLGNPGLSLTSSAGTMGWYVNTSTATIMQAGSPGTSYRWGFGGTGLYGQDNATIKWSTNGNAAAGTYDTSLSKASSGILQVGITSGGGDAGGTFSMLSDAGYPTGLKDKSQITLAFDDSSRTLTVAVTGSTFDVYCGGRKTSFASGNITKQIANTHGLHFIYWTASAAPTTGNIIDSVSPWNLATSVPIATIYWTGASGLLSDERHGITMDSSTHEYLHKTVGTRYSSGFAGTFTTTGYSVTAGEIHDEDLQFNWSAQTTGSLFYRASSSGDMVWTAPTTAFTLSSTGNILQYDNGGTLSDVNNNSYIAMWCIATNSVQSPIMWVVGQRQDNTITSARESNTPESVALGGFPTAEFKLLYRVIVQRSGTSIDNIEAQDYRTVSPLPAGNYISTSHGSLAGLENDDHPQYILHPASEASGDLYYYNGSAVARLAAGTSGQVLVTQGASAFPQWSSSLSLTAASSASQALILNAAAGQATNIQEWRNSSGGVMTAINQQGTILLSGNSLYSSSTGVITTDSKLEVGSDLVVNRFQTAAASVAALRVRPSSAHTGNLLQIENYAGGSIAKINPDGQMTVYPTGNYGGYNGMYQVVNASGHVTFCVGSYLGQTDGNIYLTASSGQGGGAGVNFRSNYGGTANSGLFQLDGGGNMVFRTQQGGLYFDNFGAGGSLIFRASGSNTVMNISNYGATTLANIVTSAIPLTINSPAGQTTLLQRWMINNVYVAQLSKAGVFQIPSGGWYNFSSTDAGDGTADVGVVRMSAKMAGISDGTGTNRNGGLYLKNIIAYPASADDGLKIYRATSGDTGSFLVCKKSDNTTVAWIDNNGNAAANSFAAANTVQMQSNMFACASGALFKWSNGQYSWDTSDVCFSRASSGVIQVGDGGANANGKIKVSDTNGILWSTGDVGLSRSGTNTLKVTDGGSGYGQFNANGYGVGGFANYSGSTYFANNYGIIWSSTTNYGGTADTSVTRASSGVLQLGDGSANASGSLSLKNLTAGGTVTTSAFKMATGASANYVLTSDASGNGTWQAASGGGSGDLSSRLAIDGSNTMSAPLPLYGFGGGGGAVYMPPSASGPGLIAYSTDRVVGGHPTVTTDTYYPIISLGVSVDGVYDDTDAWQVLATQTSVATLLTGFVPYSGAIGDVDLSYYSLYASGVGTTTLSAATVQVTSGASAGAVLTSDASGNASWQAPGAASVDFLYLQVLS